MNPDKPAVKVNGIYKTFKLPHEKQSSLKGALINLTKRKRGFEKQKALKNISFEVRQGEFFGIVGRNGSGKSTLLKLIAGIYAQDKGDIEVNGRLTPFIELGVGFSPELSGRDNVFLNGALLGFSRKEMESKYDEIVEFSELRKFMDQKLKNYSSGMQVRLAFSIAVQAHSDILVLDEVLAVGDSAFQTKCLDYFRELKKSKKTVILVSHDMSTVEKFCDRAILINDGQLIGGGSARDIAAQYEQINLLKEHRDVKRVSFIKGAKITSVKLNGKTSVVAQKNEKLILKVTYETSRDVKVAGSMSIIKSDGTFLANVNTKNDPSLETTRKGERKTLSLTIDTDQLLNGTYGVDVAIYEDDSYLDRSYNVVAFTVSGQNNTYKQGEFKLKSEWSISS